MKTLFECKDMDSAGALHNALLDYMVEPEGFENKVMIVSDQSGHDWITGWYVKLEQVARQKKGPDESEPLSRAD